METCIVKISKVKKGEDFEFDNYDKDRVNMSEGILENELATRDIVQNIIDDYARSKKFFEEGILLLKKADAIAKSISSDYAVDTFKIASSGGSLQGRLVQFCDDMRSGVWQKLSRQLNIDRYMTTKLRDDFSKFMRDQGGFAVTHNNIKQFVEFVMMNKGNILERAIEECFDFFTKHYHENRDHVEGWKTNDSWKVNKKVILPYIVEYRDWGRGGEFSLKWSNGAKMADIDKAMCFIVGRNFEHIRSIESALETSFKNGASGQCQSTFFDIRYFKKGTIHITFRDDFLWKEFNMRACNMKEWLPPEERDAWKRQKNTFTL